MVTGWRRAFCTSIPKEQNKDPQNPSPRLFTTKFNFFSSSSAPSTPRLQSRPPSATSNGGVLRCKTTANTPTSSQPNSPKLHCKTSSISPRLFKQSSSPSTPKSKANEIDPVNGKPRLLRVYNDDEPLMCSPISLAHFNPIPESEEEFNGDDYVVVDDDKQRFFVTNQQSTNVHLSLFPESIVVSANKSYETRVLMLRIKSPLSPPSTAARGSTRDRVPLDLVAVLDVSENMTGWRLQILKRAMKLVVSGLTSTDRLSVIAFSSSSKRLSPLKRMSGDGRRSARRIVDVLGCTGHGLNLNDAVKKAVKVLEDRRERNAVSRIIVLSAGHSHSNHNSSLFPLVSTTRSPQMDIPVHIVGFGNISAYNHHAPIEDVLAKCVAGLLNVVVRDLKVQLRFDSGFGSVQPQVAAVYSISGKPILLGSGSGSLQIGDMYSEEERELLIELKVPLSNGAHHNTLTDRSTMRDPLSQELIHSKEQTLFLPRPQAIRSSSSRITRLKNLHVSTRAVAESKRLVENNDVSGAYHLLTSARALLVKSGSGDEFLCHVEAELADVQPRLNRVRQQRVEMVTATAQNLTPTSAWRAAERLAKVAIMRKHMNRVSDLHGFENARF